MVTPFLIKNRSPSKNPSLVLYDRPLFLKGFVIKQKSIIALMSVIFTDPDS